MLEPEYVANEVVAGILTNQINVTMPLSTKYFLPLKRYSLIGQLFKTYQLFFTLFTFILM